MASVTPVRANASAATSPIEVYSYDPKTGTEVLAQTRDSGRSTDAVVAKTFDTVARVEDYFKTTFGRDSYDGKGAHLKVVVHAPDEFGQTPMNNAQWDSEKKTLNFGDGNGIDFAPLGTALDVAGHEFTHGVVDSSARLTYLGQQGGINESFADVLASGLDGNWLVGEDVYTPGTPGDALRDLERPTHTNAGSIPPGEDEPHVMSEVPSLAAVKAAGVIGREKLLQIWYTGLTQHLTDHSGYSGAARATLEGAAQLYGKGSAEYSAVADAWKAVGVDAHWTAARTAKLEAAHQQFVAAHAAPPSQAAASAALIADTKGSKTT